MSGPVRNASFMLLTMFLRSGINKCLGSVLLDCTDVLLVIFSEVLEGLWVVCFWGFF